jgi:hypothetical protein
LLRKCALCLLIALAALAAPIAAQAESPPQPLPADGKCAVPVDPNWTKQEQFVWLNVCVGKEADFNKEPGYDGDRDPKSPAGLPASRILRSSFLETILLKDKYRSALTRLGVRIIGARFTEAVDLKNAQLQHDLWLDRSLLEKGANLFGTKTSRRITFDRSKILGEFNAVGSQIDIDLSMYHAESDNINLAAAHIGRQFQLGGSITGAINMGDIRIDQDLFMRERAQFKQIDLSYAHIGEVLDLNSSTVTGALKMNSIRVDHGLLMHNRAEFKEIDLTAAHIGGQLDLRSSTVTGKLEGQYIDVEQTAFFGNAATFDEIDLTSAKLGQDFHLSGGTFNKDVDLTGAQIGGVLGLESSQWLGSATLNLTDAAVGAIDLSHNWPDKIYLNGLTYRNLSNLGNFSLGKAKDWFGKQPYAPQPYQQLANVLQANGRILDATAIRYAGKERERETTPCKERERETTPCGLYKAGLFLLDYSIGFGYHLEYAFYWAVGFVFLGWAVLYTTGQRTKHEITLGLAYSFDMLLPVVQLRKKHYDIDLDPWPRRYFYVHRIIGIVLASFIAAGITGLTK